MGLTESKEGLGLSSHAGSLAHVCLLLPRQALCHSLRDSLRDYGVRASIYASADALFAVYTPEDIDCLVLSTSGDEHGDGVRLLEQFQEKSLYIPTVMISTDPRVAHAVRAMQALAVECFDQHTPLPILARAIRDLALQVAKQRQKSSASL
jgi:DNA-binding NtrC family response regulator